MLTPERQRIQYGSMARHRQLFQLIDLFQPRSIVEIGTYDGKNAVNMIKHAQQYHKNIQYIGYDLFEDATDETDAREFNVKKHHGMDDVYKLISHHCPAANINLIKGNTRDTLKSVTADFVFLDGGHSVDTIRSDYGAIKHSSIIVLDDYYTADESGKVPDICSVGCNELVGDLSNCRILPVKDRLRDGGMNQMALIS